LVVVLLQLPVIPPPAPKTVRQAGQIAKGGQVLRTQ
jgi:hypothetical protein